MLQIVETKRHQGRHDQERDASNGADVHFLQYAKREGPTVSGFSIGIEGVDLCRRGFKVGQNEATEWLVFIYEV